MPPHWKQGLAQRAEQLATQGHQVLYISTLQQFAQIAPAMQSCPEGKQVVPIIDTAAIATELDALAQQANYRDVNARLRQMFDQVQFFDVRDPSKYAQFAALVGLPSSESIGGQLTAYVPEQAGQVLNQQMQALPPIPSAVAESKTIIGPNRDGATQSVVVNPNGGSEAKGGTEAYDSSDVPADSLVGRVIANRYEVKRELARGGMGAVLDVWDRSLERQAAMKVMLGQEVATEEEVERFLYEGKLNARLKHPNIVEVSDQGVDEGRRYIVQEFLTGRSMIDILEEDGPMDIDDAVRHIITAARGLQYAHSRGLMHRDIKPHNIMITNDGVVKIVDFGLAKEKGNNQGLTFSGQVMGTPAYMSPEQALAEEHLDTRTDVYSLGVTLYNLVSGAMPFEHQGMMALMAAVVNDTPTPLRDKVPHLPKDLEIIINKSMEKNPDDRYQTAADFADDLECFLNDEPIEAREHSWYERLKRWARKNTATVAAGLGITLALGTGTGGSVLYRQAQDEAEIEAKLKRANDFAQDNNIREAMTAYNSVLVLDPENKPAIQAIHDLVVQHARDLVARADSRRKHGQREQWHTPWAEYVRAGVMLDQASNLNVRGATPAEDVASLARIVSGNGSLDIKTEPADARVYAYPIVNNRGVSTIQGQVVLRYWDADETDNLEGRVYLKEGAEFIKDGKIIADGVHVATVIPGESDIPGQPYVALTNNKAEGMDTPLLDVVGEGYDTHLRMQWQRATNGRQIVIMQEPSDTQYTNGPITAPVYLGTTPLKVESFPKGNYLLVFEHDGFRDVRFHEVVERNERVVIRGDQDLEAIAQVVQNPAKLTEYLLQQTNGVRLFTNEEINRDHENEQAPFIYIPAGPVLYGAEQESVWVNGMRIAQYEVTNRDWKLFTDEVQNMGQNNSKLIPQWQSGDPQNPVRKLWIDGSPHQDDLNIWDWPVQGVTRQLAQQYVDFADVKIPSLVQWVKANGIDGRPYVWGTQFSPKYANGPNSREDKSDKWNDALPTTLDRSVYLVMDLSANVGEMSSDRFGSKYILPGGNYNGLYQEMLVNFAVVRSQTSRVGQRGMRVISDLPE